MEKYIARNVTKERLAQGKVAFGLQVRLVPSVAIARMAATAGYHYLFIDMEHNVLDIGAVGEICLASLDAGVTPTVRIPGSDYSTATRLFEAGCQGIVVPHVTSAADAREAVKHCKFAPLGERSFAGSPPQLGWAPLSPKRCAELLNENLQITVTIESKAGLENVEEIAAVEGIDAITVGSNDLAFDIGIPGEFDNPILWKAFERIVAAGKRNKVPVRLGGSFDPKFLQRTVEMGALMVSVSSDLRLLVDASRTRLSAVSTLLDPALTGD